MASKLIFDCFSLLTCLLCHLFQGYLKWQPLFPLSKISKSLLWTMTSLDEMTSSVKPQLTWSRGYCLATTQPLDVRNFTPSKSSVFFCSESSVQCKVLDRCNLVSWGFILILRTSWEYSRKLINEGSEVVAVITTFAGFDSGLDYSWVCDRSGIG